jgi:hypothetical protein
VLATASALSNTQEGLVGKWPPKTQETLECLSILQSSKETQSHERRVAFPEPAFVHFVQIDDHHNTGLCRHASQCDEAHLHRYTRVVVQQIDEPDTSNQGEWNRQHDNQYLGDRVKV